MLSSCKDQCTLMSKEFQIIDDLFIDPKEESIYSKPKEINYIRNQTYQKLEKISVKLQPDDGVWYVWVPPLLKLNGFVGLDDKDEKWENFGNEMIEPIPQLLKEIYFCKISALRGHQIFRDWA